MLFAFLMGVSACQSDAVIVTGQATGAPPGCSAHDVAQRLVDLFDAINRGDPNVVPEFFGRKESERFQWYSIGERGKAGTAENLFVAHRLDELAAYFVERYTQHEHLQLRRLKVNGWDEGRGLVHFGPVEFTRTADDLVLPPGDTASQGTGKGAYHCAGRVFVVLSLVSPALSKTDTMEVAHSTSSPQPIRTNQPFNCPITKPNGSQPPDDEVSSGQNHGNGALWTVLPTDGILYVRRESNGQLGIKLPWWRGVTGALTIEGRRLDGVGEFSAHISDGYGESGFQASGVYFSSEGCWELVGRAGSAELKFVVDVKTGE